MAQISNPRKVFNFSVQIAPIPIDPFLAQKVTIPESSVDVVEHGDVNYDVKTGGRRKFGNIMMEKLQTTSGADNYMWDWMSSVQDAVIGGGLVPPFYKRIMTIFELAEDGSSILNTHICTGVWPNKINGIDLSRTESDNTIESIEFCVDIIDKI